MREFDPELLVYWDAIMKNRIKSKLDNYQTMHVLVALGKAYGQLIVDSEACHYMRNYEYNEKQKLKGKK